MISPVNLEFRLYPLRFHFAALEPLAFPEGKAGNVFRGAPGIALRQAVCVPYCPGFAGLPSSVCPVARDCSYAQLFEPTCLGLAGPSGLENRPRAFVLRASHLDGRALSLGDSFHVDLHLFLTGSSASNAIASLTKAFGSIRTGVALTAVTRIDVPESPVDSEPMILSLAPLDAPCSRIRIDFLTPTELKMNGQIAERPAFGILFKRIRDRVSTLAALYGAGPLSVDFRGLAERAERVQLDRCLLTQVELARRSSRTGQTHGLSGFIGNAEYSGDLHEFLPWLRAAEWTGVGRQTVWGKGYLQVHKISPETD